MPRLSAAELETEIKTEFRHQTSGSQTTVISGTKAILSDIPNHSGVPHRYWRLSTLSSHLRRLVSQLLACQSNFLEIWKTGTFRGDSGRHAQSCRLGSLYRLTSNLPPKYAVFTVVFTNSLTLAAPLSSLSVDSPLRLAKVSKVAPRMQSKLLSEGL